MTFEEALKLMREGKSIRRASWMADWPSISLSNLGWTMKAEGLLATDWQDASDFDIDDPAGDKTDG